MRLARVTLLLTGAFFTAAGLAGQGQSAPPPSDDPGGLVRAWLDASDASSRRQIVTRLAAHRDYRPSRVGDWLHRASSFPDLRSGIDVMRVDVGGGDLRQVVVRVPDGYRPDRAWPLIYALHPSGADGAVWAARIEQWLGLRASRYVIAAPTSYRQNYIASKPPFTPEHPALLDALVRRVHVDTDRIYVVGYSMGGFGAWFVSLFYPDRFAGAAALAAAYDVAVDDDGFWKVTVGNVANLPVLNAWGELDVLEVQGLDEKRAGTFAEQNRRFERWVAPLKLPIVNVEVAGASHYDLVPPSGRLDTLLTGRRRKDPRRVDHVFRHLHQASCYWLEGLEWVGDRWGEAPPPRPATAAGETDRHVIARTLEPLLGRLTGSIDGQVIRVTRRHVGALVVWIGDRTIEWGRPVTIEVDGATVFNGTIARDLGLCLARAEATRDFAALRWAGVRIDASGRASVLTAETMPVPAWKQAPPAG